MYNHSDSPVPRSFDMESVNIAAAPRSAQQQMLVNELHDVVKRQFTAPYPPAGPPAPPAPPRVAGFVERPAHFCSDLQGKSLFQLTGSPALTICAAKCRQLPHCLCFDHDSSKCRGVDVVSLKPSFHGMSAFVRSALVAASSVGRRSAPPWPAGHQPPKRAGAPMPPAPPRVVGPFNNSGHQ